LHRGGIVRYKLCTRLTAELLDAESAALLPTTQPMLARGIDRGAFIWLADVLDTLESHILSRQATW